MHRFLANCTGRGRRLLVVAVVLLGLCGVTLMLAGAAMAGAGGPLEGRALSVVLTPTPTPTCCGGVTGTISSHCDGSVYRYTYALTNSCPVTVTASGSLSFETSPNSTGPWMPRVIADYFTYPVPPGYSEQSGYLWSGPLPSGDSWWRYQLNLNSRLCWSVNVASAAQPACIGGTVTPVTATRTATATPTPAAGLCNTTPIAIPTNGIAVPYPSGIEVAGLSGTVSGVSVSIYDLQHSFLDDVDILLVAPLGQSVLLMADVGDSCTQEMDLTFQDGAPPLPDAGCPPTGTYRPTNYPPDPDLFPLPAPPPPYGNEMAVFNGTQPNGMWGLYVLDDYGAFAGRINGGWCINITTSGGTSTPTATRTVMPTSTINTATATRTATVTMPTATATCPPSGIVVSSPNPGATNNMLQAIDGFSGSDAWAAGYFGDGNAPLRTLVEHWNGAEWSVVASPNRATNSILQGIEVIAPNDVWAVGYSGDGTTAGETLIQHWNGSQWTIVPSPNSQLAHNQLNGVSAVSPSDVWAVGYSRDTATTRIEPLILHWNGTAWALVPSPSPATRFNVLHAVDAISSNDVWAVGTTTDDEGGQMLTMHWNGVEWTIVPSPSPTGVTTNLLLGVSAVSGSDVWAVGVTGDFAVSGGPDRTLTMHWDGTSWVIVPSPNVSNRSTLFDVEARASNDVWAVGLYQPPGAAGTLAMRWNGAAWALVNSPDDGDLRGIEASAAGVWAVGSRCCDASRTLVVRYTGGCPTPTSTPGISTPTPCPVHFSDVLPGHTFYEGVRCLACQGVVSGYADGTFRPDNEVTRGQLAKMVSNAAGFQNEPGPQIYEDVPPENTFYQWIDRLTRRGIMSGYVCGGESEPCGPKGRPYFRPVANATRGQTSKIVANAAGFSEPVSGQTFEDVPPGHTFYEVIERLAARSVMGGYSCGGVGEPCVPPGFRPYFRPQNNVTRGQSAKIVANTFYPGCQTP